jgi:hypothetical protein
MSVTVPVLRTWDHTQCNSSIGGLAITDLNGDGTCESAAEDWEFVEGQNGAVERSLNNNHMFNFTYPMMATSPQLDALETLSQADKKTGAGPYPFAFVRIGSSFKITGLATIMSIAPMNSSKKGTARNVKIAVVGELVWLGT